MELFSIFGDRTLDKKYDYIYILMHANNNNKYNLQINSKEFDPNYIDIDDIDDMDDMLDLALTYLLGVYDTHTKTILVPRNKDKFLDHLNSNIEKGHKISEYAMAIFLLCNQNKTKEGTNILLKLYREGCNKSGENLAYFNWINRDKKKAIGILKGKAPNSCIVGIEDKILLKNYKLDCEKKKKSYSSLLNPYIIPDIASIICVYAIRYDF